MTVENPVQKKRHWALTFYLVFCIAAMLMSLVGLSSMKDFVMAAKPETPQWLFIAIPISIVSAIICTIALFRFKKWGFWAQIPLTLGMFAANFYAGQIDLAAHPVMSFYGLLGPVVLFGFLKIGKENQAWKQLD